MISLKLKINVISVYLLVGLESNRDIRLISMGIGLSLGSHMPVLLPQCPLAGVSSCEE